MANWKERTGLGFLAGFDHRTYLIDPDGNYFVNYVKDREYDDFTYSKIGGSIQVG